MKPGNRFIKPLKVLIASAVAASLITGCSAPSSSSTPSSSGGQSSTAADTSTQTSSESSPKELVTVRLGRVTSGATASALDAAVRLGKFEEAGINLEITDFSNGADGIAALIGGSLDLFNGSYEHVLRQRENGLDVKAFALLNNRQSYKVMVRSDSALQTLEELRGAKIGVTKVGSLSDTTLRKILREVGVDPERDVEIVNAGTGATAVAALESGNVEAAMIGGTTVAQLVNGGDYRVMYDPNFETAGLVLLGTTKWAEANGDALKTYLAVFQKQLLEVKSNPADFLDLFRDDFKDFDDELLTQVIRDENARFPDDLVVTKAAADDVVKTQLEQGTIKTEIPLEEAFDGSYLPN